MLMGNPLPSVVSYVDRLSQSLEQHPQGRGLALGLLKQFADEYPKVRVKAILADALYGRAEFMQRASGLFHEIQVISQLRRNQKVEFRGRQWRVDECFRAYPGVSQMIRVRGGEPTEVLISSAHLYVQAQQRKCLFIALRYGGESEYRYLVACDFSWRTLDIVQAYTLSWLVGVAIEDLKVHEGWGQSTNQPGVEGSRRGLILSLLCDHCLLLHPEQRARVEHQEPLYIIGSLQRRLQIQALVAWFDEWLDGDELADKINQLTQAIQPLFALQPSEKHMHNRDLGRLEPPPGLKCRAQQVQAMA